MMDRRGFLKLAAVSPIAGIALAEKKPVPYIGNNAGQDTTLQGGNDVFRELNPKAGPASRAEEDFVSGLKIKAIQIEIPEKGLVVEFIDSFERDVISITVSSPDVCIQNLSLSGFYARPVKGFKAQDVSFMVWGY